ncbi:MAG: carbohydrate ABC transporter permease, partial [Alkalispirochaeta sp.]
MESLERRREQRARVLFALPFLMPLFVFWFVPLVVGFGISFTDWDYISPHARFVGLENYRDMLLGRDFGAALKNTVVFGLGSIISTMVLGLVFALMLQGTFSGSKMYQRIIF